MRLASALVLLVAACGSGKNECSEAIGHAQDLTTRQPASDDKIRGAMAAANRAMVARCSDDRWSQEAIACLKGASSPRDLKPCEDKLMPDQKQSLVKAIQEAIATAGLGSAAGGGGDREQLDGKAAVAQAKALKTKMCDCLASQCAKDVEGESHKLIRATEAARQDPAVKQEYGAIDDEMMQCYKHVLEHDPAK